MILVTGGTGFIGRALVRRLVEQGLPVRLLIRPSPDSPNLPLGQSVEVAVCSLSDARGLRAALKGVDIVYHLVGAEQRGGRGDLMQVDITGSRLVAEAANEAGVERLYYLSHLGADRASAFPLQKAKAIAESQIRQTGVRHTILRSAVVFGHGDRFSTGLAALIRALPGIFLLPDEGATRVQPLWVEDLVTCLVWALDRPDLSGQTLSIGGPEILSLREIVIEVMRAMNIRRTLLSASPLMVRGLTVFMESLFPAFPSSVFWMDYLAVDRTCPTDTIPRIFGLLPAIFSQRLGHLSGPLPSTNLARLLLKRRA